MKDILVKILYFGNTHGSFLRYFIDRFSALTPEITDSPFTENGSSHSRQVKYSNRVVRYHPSNSTDPKFDLGSVDPAFFRCDESPHILITFEQKDVLSQVRLRLTRGAGVDYTSMSLSRDGDEILCPERFVLCHGDDILKIYGLDLRSSPRLPAIILRDYLKMLFLAPETHRDLCWLNKIIKSNGDKLIAMPISHFYDWGLFSSSIEGINHRLGLQIQLDGQGQRLHQEFMSRLPIAGTMYRADRMIEHTRSCEDQSLAGLDVAEEAYIAAWIEKNYEFVLSPLTNRFFSSTGEIQTYVKHYPQHYKAMNPNMTHFRGIPNPFYLWHKGNKS